MLQVSSSELFSLTYIPSTKKGQIEGHVNP